MHTMFCAAQNSPSIVYKMCKQSFLNLTSNKIASLKDQRAKREACQLSRHLRPGGLWCSETVRPQSEAHSLRLWSASRGRNAGRNAPRGRNAYARLASRAGGHASFLLIKISIRRAEKTVGWVASVYVCLAPSLLRALSRLVSISVAMISACRFELRFSFSQQVV